MVACSIRKCKSRSAKGGTIMFFRFPKKESVADEWVRHCRPKTTAKNGRVCSNHFLTSDYIKSLHNTHNEGLPTRCRMLKPDAIPSLQIDNTDIPMATDTLKICNIDKPEVLPSTQIADIDTQNISIGSIDLPSKAGSICNMKSFSVECNTTPANEIVGSSKIVKECDIITNLLAENKQLQMTDHTYSVLKHNLEKMFTSGQIRCLMKPNMRRVRWSAEDIAAAISLKSISPEGYRHLRGAVGIPLPSFTTLHKCSFKFKIDEGILENVITLMKFKAKCFNAMEKLVTLAFDEIYVSNKIEIDKTYEQKVGPHNKCQFVMARGLCGKWKQPIYFKYDQKMTKEILFNIIKKLHKAGFVVVSVTCNMGPGNQGLMRSLNIGVGNGQQTYFDHPGDTDLKVHVFFDVPHLLKLARNHFIDYGFVYNNKVLTKKTIEKILLLSQKDVKLAHKVTSHHLNLEGLQRKKVRPAAQLFSNTMAKAIEWCGIKDFLPDENWLDLSYVFKVVNDWFDIFNARSKFEGNKNAYGIKLDEQNLVLDKMNHMMQNIITGKKNTKLKPFQRGILISNKSLVNLFNDLKGRADLNLDYILTSRLNQDILRLHKKKILSFVSTM